MANLSIEITSGLPVSYQGCLRQLFVNYKHVVLNENSIKSARNVADCDGTPCGADVCANGGTCWLNTTLIPHCMCPQVISVKLYKISIILYKLQILQHNFTGIQRSEMRKPSIL